MQKGYLLGFVICLGLLLEILGIAALIKYYYVNIKKKAKKGYLRNSPDVIDGLITAQEFNNVYTGYIFKVVNKQLIFNN